jgi:hypothetical protein
MAAMRARAAAILVSAMVVACGNGPAQEPTDAADRTPSDFVRFVREGDGGHLDTAITTYRKGGQELLLFGAVHIADQACFELLNDRFTLCDVLLYELVGPETYRPTKAREERGFNPVSMLQQGLKNSMELAFQLDAIDYLPANFVHADMTPEEFEQSMAERGESLLSIMVEMMLTGMQQQVAKADAEGGGDAPSGEPFDLVKAFRSGEGRHTLRMAFASQLEEMELLAAGAKTGGTLLQGRNEKCLRVLERELGKGHTTLGIYYGAAHLPHLEQRLVQDLGWRKTGHEWIVAWNCAKRLDPKYDRDLVKLRQRAKAELRDLATAARDHRVRAEPAAVPTPAELAAQQHSGKPVWSGPVQDPWGKPYVLQKRRTGRRWEACSAGQDGELGTADDLVVQEPARGLFGR